MTALLRAIPYTPLKPQEAIRQRVGRKSLSLNWTVLRMLG